MKIIIISDITGNYDSIIPFGLNLGKQLEAKVEIVHPVDPRMQQGVNSSQANSQSISMGDPLSHQKILEKEKSEVNRKLTNLLSREASRLNYPLKIKHLVEENTLQKTITNSLTDNANTLLVVNGKPDGQILHSEKEIIEITEKTDVKTFIVSPGKQFELFNKLLLITDDFKFSQKIPALLKKMEGFTDVLTSSPDLEIIIVTKSSIPDEEEWLEKDRLTSILSSNASSSGKVSFISGKNQKEELLVYISESMPDLVIPLMIQNGILSGNSHKRLLKYLLEISQSPVIFTLSQYNQKK